MSTEHHLILQKLVLPPSGEWRPDSSFWAMVRIASGFGYCLADSAARELKAGDAVVVGPKSGVIFRASQLGELPLEYFTIDLQLINGLIAVTEWHQLEKVSSQNARRVLHHAASESLAQKFSRLAMLSQREGLSARLAFLQLWASCLSSLLPTPSENGNGGRSLRWRFHQFFSQLSEKELTTRSLTDMAKELNCSERHLSRIFQGEFGVSLRACQNELRLQRACRLLSDSNAKISIIAQDSGYRHLGLFNLMFKQRFGFTPSQWRLQKLRAQLPGAFEQDQSASAPQENGADVMAVTPSAPSQVTPSAHALKNIPDIATALGSASKRSATNVVQARPLNAKTRRISLKANTSGETTSEPLLGATKLLVQPHSQLPDQD